MCNFRVVYLKIYAHSCSLYTSTANSQIKNQIEFRFGGIKLAHIVDFQELSALYLVIFSFFLQSLVYTVFESETSGYFALI